MVLSKELQATLDKAERPWSRSAEDGTESIDFEWKAKISSCGVGFGRLLWVTVASSLRESHSPIHAGNRELTFLHEVLEILHVTIRPAPQWLRPWKWFIQEKAITMTFLPWMMMIQIPWPIIRQKHSPFGWRMLYSRSLCLDSAGKICLRIRSGRLTTYLTSGSPGHGFAGAGLDMEGEHQHLSLEELQTIHAEQVSY